MRKLPWLVALMIGSGPCSQLLSAAAGAASPMNTEQAERMVAFVAEVVGGQGGSPPIEVLVELRGTELIVEQMNLFRKVSMDQYAEVLSALRDGRELDLAPVDDGERARRGVDGLERGVFPSLIWAKSNLPALRASLAQAQERDLPREAIELAASYLPEAVEISPKIYLVMGGRAGFAALSDQAIYYDVLYTAYVRDRLEMPPISEDEILAFFAHEIHHLGLDEILESQVDLERFDTRQKRVWEVLYSLLAEGSATYLINARRDLESLQPDRSYGEFFEDPEALLTRYAKMFRETLEGTLGDQQQFEVARSALSGNSDHVAGAILIHALDQAGGLEAVMATLSDPGRLLRDFNRAQQQIGPAAFVDFRFAEDLANEVAGIGN